MKIKMSDEQFAKIWRSSNLPVEFRERIVGEIDLLMFDDDPVDLTDNAANTRRLLYDLRYLSAICYHELDELLAYLEDTVAIRLHQLKGTRLEIPADNRCVCCGEIIPEGRQVCPICEGGKSHDNN